MIRRLVDDPRVVDAARIAAVFGQLPDVVLDCTSQVWAVRAAAAQVLARDRQEVSRAHS